MVQLPVLQRLIATFSAQWDATSSHAFRASDDMQFAFSYFYFLINERQNSTLGQTFSELDVDRSGSLDHNEWRTLWLTFHDPPVRTMVALCCVRVWLCAYVCSLLRSCVRVCVRLCM